MNTILRNENNTFSLMPQPLLLVIFQYLTVADLGRASNVCHEWSHLIRLNEVWLNRLQRDFPESPPEPNVPSKTAYSFKCSARKTQERLKEIMMGSSIPLGSANLLIRDVVNRDPPRDYRFFNNDVERARYQAPRVDENGIVHYAYDDNSDDDLYDNCLL